MSLLARYKGKTMHTDTPTARTVGRLPTGERVSRFACHAEVHCDGTSWTQSADVLAPTAADAVNAYHAEILDWYGANLTGRLLDSVETHTVGHKGGITHRYAGIETIAFHAMLAADRCQLDLGL